MVNTIMTNEHSSLEKYTSHTLFEMVAKGICVRGELETEQNCNKLTSSSSGYSSTPFSFSSATQIVGRKPSAGSWFSRWHLISKTLTPTNWTSCRTGLYHCLTSTCFLGVLHLHPTQHVYGQGCTCYLHRCISYLTARPGRRSICYNMSSGSFKNISHKLCFKIIYSIYMHLYDLALNNLQCFICHKPNQLNLLQNQ